MVSWFTQIEVIDLTFHHFLFTAKGFWCQPTASQYFQPLIPQTLALAANAIHCAVSDYASGIMAKVIFSQDEYQGTFCPSLVLNLTPEASALINHTLVGRITPPHVPLNSAGIGVPVSPSALLSLDSCFTISFCSQLLFVSQSSTGVGFS